MKVNFNTLSKSLFMKNFYFLFLMFFVQILNSQTVWSPVGAEWYYDYFHFAETGYTKIKYIEDTTIDNTICKVLEKTKYTYSYIENKYDTLFLGKEYTYSNGNIVYYYRFNRFYILYDFNSVLQDTWQIAGTMPTESYNEYCDSTATVFVDSSNTIHYNSFDLKRLYVSYSDTNKWLLYGEIIERIGAFSYMFPKNNCLIDAQSEGGELRCYYDNEIGFFHSGLNECDFILNVFDDIEMKYIKIYPSCTKSFINIELNKNNLHLSKFYREISIYNIFGQKYYTKNIENLTNLHKVDVSLFTNGIYFVRIGDATFKFIKE